MRNILILVLLALSSFGAIAYDESSSSTTVTYIYSGTNGGKPYVKFGPNSLPGCHNDKGAYLSNSNEKGLDRTYSLIMAAYMSQRPVTVYYNHNTSGSGWSLCDIVAINVH